MLRKIEAKTQTPMKSNLVDHILFFIIGALNPVLIVISVLTTWTELTTPLYILGMLYGGATNVVALRKKLYQTLPDMELPPNTNFPPIGTRTQNNQSDE